MKRNRILPFSIFEGIEKEGRLSETIIDILNKQIKKELMSSQIYRGMSCWLDNEGWVDAPKYFFTSAQEELTHMDKIYQYLFDRNVLAKVPVTEEVKQELIAPDEKIVCAITLKDNRLQIITADTDPKQVIIYLSQAIIEITKTIK